ncbi:MAG TPA: hypothetical protein VKJ65_11895, partial [Phycisphaerae bacterium]|nr:hypothetical protein [Phycisphaerae bacterium]
MNILIIKLGATGDVVRTTPLLRRLTGTVTWITAAKNIVLLQELQPPVHCLSWEQRDQVANAHYDLVINLEDDLEISAFTKKLKSRKFFGACLNAKGTIEYTTSSRCWFDMSLISTFGKERADFLKLQNRRTYQDMIFSGLGISFAGETYVMPGPVETGLAGDVAIAPEAGSVWPMKRWAYYNQLKRELEL